jgi:hypothetical protein
MREANRTTTGGRECEMIVAKKEKLIGELVKLMNDAEPTMILAYGSCREISSIVVSNEEDDFSSPSIIKVLGKISGCKICFDEE